MSVSTYSVAAPSLTRRNMVLWGGFIAPLIVFLCFTYLFPLAGVIAWSFTDPEPGVTNYVRIATDPGIQGIFWRTFRICAATAILSVLLAYVLAYQWTFGPPLRQRVIALAVLIPFWISVLIRAFGWLALLRPRGLINEVLIGAGVIDAPLSLVRNELGVVIGMVHFMVPFAVFPLLSVMRQMDMTLLKAARGLGAGPIRRFFEIFLPLTIPGVIGAFFIVFVFSLGFFITPTILGGGRVVMVAEYVFTQMSQTANWGLGAALASVLLAFIVVIVFLVSRVIDLERLAK